MISVTIYEIEVTTDTGGKYPLSDYEGKVMLIVNTATKCGFTPQFEELEALFQKHKDEGFVVLGFPSNQFKQELDSGHAAAEKCRLDYGVTFPMHELTNVNGAHEHELFTYLKDHSKGFLGNSIKWNFTKFLVDRQGHVVERYASKDKPSSFEDDIIQYLKK